MRHLLFILLLLPLSLWAQKKQKWPGVPFSTVRLYMYNIKGNLYGYHSIVKEGKLDKTVWDTGIALNRTQESRLLDLFNQDIALLQQGLAECYIPHHGFVFYDENNTPVAWASVCFMCDAARVYFPAKVDKPAKYNPVNEKKVHAQIAELKSIVEETGYPIFKMPEQYIEHFKKLEADKKKSKVEITSDQLIDQIFFKEIYPNNINDFIENDTVKVIIKPDHKFTGGGRRMFFFKGTYKNSTFSFSGPDENKTYLDRAVVKDFNVKLVNKINIGMSFDEVLSLMIYDGISNPDEVTITNESKSKKLILRFINGNLQEYEMIDEGY